MSRPAFRFRPPATPPPPELAWVLARAFAPPGAPAPPPGDAARALALAARLGLLPRIAVRGEPAALAAELGEAGVERLRDERALAAARELRFDETLARVAQAAQSIGTEIAPLKGRALVLAGEAPPGTRPSVDLDLLAPSAALAPLHAELVRRGFVATRDRRHDHQLAALRHPEGELVELHRHLPGVRLDGKRSATWEALERAGSVTPAGAAAPPGVRLVGPKARLAHALVHALAQHGHTARLPGWLLVGDLLDLGEAVRAGDAWRRWIAPDVSEQEIDAALALAAACAAGRDPFAAVGPAEAALLARHFLACALDADYAEAIKLDAWRAPLSDRSPASARWLWLGRALAPPAGAVDEPLRARVGRRLARPFVLARKLLGALAARRRHEG